MMLHRNPSMKQCSLKSGSGKIIHEITPSGFGGGVHSEFNATIPDKQACDMPTMKRVTPIIFVITLLFNLIQPYW